ncbi:MAG: hypothetical protein ACOCYT_05655 [Chloroflexota bacterium]
MYNYYPYDEDDSFPEELVVYRLPQYEDEQQEDEPVWTLRRIIFLVIALVMIIAVLVAYFLAPAIDPMSTAPPPTPQGPPPVLV